MINKDFAFIKPFGPVIYSNLLNPDVVNVLNECKTVSEYIGDDIGYMLAGAINSQLRLVRTAEQEQIIYDHIFEHFAAYMDRDPESLKKEYKIPNNGIWLNVQRAGEFNPPHHHDGHFSGVIYLEVPPELAEENKKKPVGFHLHGEISFYYGDDIGCQTYFHMMPRVAQMVIFPAKLQHGVHPFYSDVRRVSVAFNLYKLAEPMLLVDS